METHVALFNSGSADFLPDATLLREHLCWGGVKLAASSTSPARTLERFDAFLSRYSVPWRSRPANEYLRDERRIVPQSEVIPVLFCPALLWIHVKVVLFAVPLSKGRDLAKA